MSTETTDKEIFEDDEFWFRIGVDYKDVQNSVDSSEELFDELLKQFSKRKRKVIDRRYGSFQDFKDGLRESDHLRRDLFSVFAESIWVRHWNTGVQFTSTEGDPDEFLDDLGGDIDYERVDDEYGIIWPTDSRIRREKLDGAVVGTRPDETTPIVVRKQDDGFSVRDPTPSASQAIARLRQHDSVEEVEPESSSEEVTAKVQRFLQSQNDDIAVIGLKFNESELPGRSRLRIKNEREISDDLAELENNNIISLMGVSALQKIFLRDNRSGGKYRVEVIHGNDGFQFELQAPGKLEQVREQFKRRFTDKTGIEFDIVYEYGSQNQALLFNRVMSGDPRAYDLYYDDLEGDLQEYIDEFTDRSERELKKCVDPYCRETISAKDNMCPECGGKEFTESFTDVEIDINAHQINRRVKQELESLTPAPEDFDVVDWGISKQTMNDRPIVTADFQATEFADAGGSTVTRQEVFFVPQGDWDQPRQVNNYLLKTVFVTFGDSAIGDFQGFGRISLYDLLITDNPDSQVGEALTDALTRVQTRIFGKADEAYHTASKYLEILGETDALENRREGLEEYYNPNNPNLFEKHVFYLLKGLFILSERWGRTGEKEADALLVIPRPNTQTDYAAKVDSKLSHNRNGYGFDTGDEDQAARYLLTENGRKALRAKTQRNIPSAHILISQNFDPSDFPRMARGIHDNLSNYTGEESPDIVFMEFESLVRLYEFELNHHEQMDNPNIKSRFRELVLQELTNRTRQQGASYVHFNESSVEEIEDGLLRLIDQYDHDPVKTYSE